MVPLLKRQTVVLACKEGRPLNHQWRAGDLCSLVYTMLSSVTCFYSAPRGFQPLCGCWLRQKWKESGGTEQCSVGAAFPLARRSSPHCIDSEWLGEQPVLESSCRLVWPPELEVCCPTLMPRNPHRLASDLLLDLQRAYSAPSKSPLSSTLCGWLTSLSITIEHRPAPFQISPLISVHPHASALWSLPLHGRGLPEWHPGKIVSSPG